MELNKKKYAKKEVELILKDNATLYENKLFEQKARISELIKEVETLQSELEVYKDKQSFIDKALINAESQAKKIQEKTEQQYNLTVEKLKSFYTKWNDYFKRLSVKYPLYPAVKEAKDLVESLNVLFKAKNVKSALDKMDDKISSKSDKNSNVFNPKRKIEDYIASTSDNGFSLEEVLNPGELQLEDLCKELGLIEE